VPQPVQAARLGSNDEVLVTNAYRSAEKSGSWYGSTDYQDGFLELWGVS
jgi:hypothetical protein